MVHAGLAISTVNKAVGIIKRIFQWAVEEELVAAATYQALQAVSDLKRRRSQARAPDPVEPVAEEAIEAVLPYVSPQIAAMIRLQLLTGMRPGEVVAIRGCDLDTSDSVWVYAPESHKTQHHGRKRTIDIGPDGQKLLTEWLKNAPQAYIFSPAEAEAARNEARRGARKSRMTPSQANRSRTRRRKRPLKPYYTETAYRRAIHRACDQAFPPPEHLARQHVWRQTGWCLENNQEWCQRLGDTRWEELKRWRTAHRWSPNQLRHNAGTYIRKHYGLEAARTVLGHTSPAVTEVYAELDFEKARRIISEIG
jgi:integrase